MRYQRKIFEIAALTALAASAGCSPLLELDGTATAAAKPADRRAAPGIVTGLGSCAAGGCHGQPDDGTRQAWQTAYAVWNRDDPHRRAFEVLYTERSVEIYRNLNPETKRAGQPPEDRDYFRFLQERCIGCHATGLKDPARMPDDHLAGVSCESCHGPANGWLGEHVLTNWPQPGSAGRDGLAAKGFRDTANLRTRAAICGGCHIGPQEGNGRLYDVNHDLIAAGHPRLAFEFSSYLQNYPPHWDPAADARRHAAVTGGSFHVDAWRFGQEQSARQLVRQIGLRLAAAASGGGGSVRPDFSNFQCIDCHHALTSPAGSERLARGGMPRPALAPLDNFAQLRQPGRDNRPAALLTAADTDAIVRALDTSPLPPCRPTDLTAHVQFLLWMLDRASHSQATFDQAVDLYLAAAALARDLPADDKREHLEQAAQRLSAALSAPENFGTDGQRVTQYDSPAAFDPQRIAPNLAQLRAALVKIASSAPQQTPP